MDSAKATAVRWGPPRRRGAERDGDLPGVFRTSWNL